MEIVIDHQPNQADNAVLSDGVFESHSDLIGKRDESFSVFLKNDSGQILGGAQVSFDTESCYVNSLWVDSQLRRQGYG